MGVCGLSDRSRFALFGLDLVQDHNSWVANKLVYTADDAMQDFYRTKATQARRRGRGHASRKNRPANMQ